MRRKVGTAGSTRGNALRDEDAEYRCFWGVSYEVWNLSIGVLIWE